MWYNVIVGGRLKSNFRRYGQMEKQRWEESEKRREEKSGEEKRREERRDQKRKSQKKESKKEDAGARKAEKSRNTVLFSNDLWLRRVEK